jgi:hypothetical protein
MTEPQHKYKYDKGENRPKHQGTDRAARIVDKYGEEVGECPRGFSLHAAQKLLDDAIEEHRSRQPDVPFRLWSYHDGAVYQARTSDGGMTWHGWPVQGSRIPDNIRRQLDGQADALGERSRLNQWLRKRF